jgi:glycosyltransferase involved in cell wall biosynthesis
MTGTRYLADNISENLSSGECSSVSVILIVRNGQALIAEALDSVFQSTIRPAEILVVDGDSTDRTVEIAQSFPLVRVIHQTSTGIARAYNEGIAQAQGKLIAFISHDDLWVPGKLDKQIAYMRRNPKVLYTVAMVQHGLAPGSTVPAGFRRELLERPVPGMMMETLVARRRVFARVGEFDPDFPIAEDTDWFARARDANVEMALLPDVLLHKRIHGANASLTELRSNGLLLRAMRSSVRRKKKALAGGSDGGR